MKALKYIVIFLIIISCQKKKEKTNTTENDNVSIVHSISDSINNTISKDTIKKSKTIISKLEIDSTIFKTDNKEKESFILNSAEFKNLEKLKINIDTLLSKKELVVEVLVQEPNQNFLTVVINQNWPEIVETTYNIWKDKNGKILKIAEYPYSESGDWFISYEHYFDQYGDTFAFEQNTNSFNSLCTEGVAYEKIIEYYDIEFNKIARIYSLTDKENRQLNKDECVNLYDYEYEISENLITYTTKINYGG